MLSIIRNAGSISRPNISARLLSSTSVLETKQYRLERGLSLQRTAEGVLTDAPDYTFLDGRPTPLLHKQKLRMLKQQDFATKIVDLCSEIDFAKERYQNMQKEKEDERQRVLANRLRPKGRALKNK